MSVSLAHCGLIVLPGHESAFEQMEQGLRGGLQPTGELQEVIFTRLLESAWNLHRCRVAESQLYLSTGDQTIDPLLDVQNEAKYARIQKYARQSESSMLKMVRELGKLQTEKQFRKEAFPLTEQQAADPEKFKTSVQALPELCQVDKVTANIVRLPIHNKAKSADAAFLALLDKVTAPPQRRLEVTTMTGELRKANAAGR